MKLYLMGGPASLWSPCSQMERVLLRGGANDAFDAKTLLDGVAGGIGRGVLIGYPHLLPSLRGQALGDAIEQIDALVGVDLNGVQPSHYLGTGPWTRLCIRRTSSTRPRTRRRRSEVAPGYHCTPLARALCDATGGLCCRDGRVKRAGAVVSDQIVYHRRHPWPAVI